MNAATAGKLIAPYIGRSWPTDRRVIFQNLKLAVNKSWNEGKYDGQTKEYEVPIYSSCDGNFIVGPYSHNVLLAINIDFKPKTIRSNEFKFHKNGNGFIQNRQGCRWIQDVYDLGEFPTMQKITDNFQFIVGVRSLGMASPDEKIWIDGVYSNSDRIYTYKKKEAGIETCGCVSKQSTVETVSGIELDISHAFNYINNIKFGDIASIHKTITRCPVEVMIIDPATGNGIVVARLQPNQTVSKYRRYMVPDSVCKNSCAYGLFKIREQEDIVSDTDTIIIDNEEALISLAMSIDYTYEKKNPQEGALYFLQAISILDKNKMQKSSPDEFPIQIRPMHEGDMPSILNYLS